MAKYDLIQKDWKECCDIAKKLYEGNEFLSPYSDYCFLSKILRSPNIRQRKEFKKCKLYCFILYKNDYPIYIVPLFLNQQRKRLYLAGHFSSVGHLDLIYDRTVELDDFKAMLDLISERFSGNIFYLDRISQFSKTQQFLSEMNVDETNKEICVKIDFDNYDSWFKSLSKGHRQNIRTAYNRINREGNHLSFMFFYNKNPEKHFYKDHISLFSKRLLEHSRLPSLLYLPLKILKKREALSNALLNYENKLFSGVYFNNVLVASMNGVVSNDGRAIITRLSINRKYGVYCPGGLLLNETIKALFEQRIISIKSLDLSRGNEKYKYAYGGREHYNYCYKIKLPLNQRK